MSGYIKRSEDGKEMYDVKFKNPEIGPIVGRLYSGHSNRYLEIFYSTASICGRSGSTKARTRS